MRILISVLFLTGLALASPALAREKGAPAQSAAPALVPSSDPGAQMVAEVAAYTAGFQTLLGDGSVFFSDYMDAAERAVSGKPGDNAWVEGWMTQTRARLAALRARRAALGPPPASLLARMRAQGLGEDAKALEDAPKTMGGPIDALLDLCDQVMALVPDAARGDPAARAKLMKTLTRGSRTALASENAMMEAGLLRLEASNPQAALLRSILASNSAMIALMDLSTLIDENPKADPAPLVQTVMSQLQTARSEAQKVGPLAQRMTVALQSVQADEGFKKRLILAMGTYDESGRVEVQIVDTIQAMLANEDPAKSQALGEELQTLVDRRLKLQTDRQTMLGG